MHIVRREDVEWRRRRDAAVMGAVAVAAVFSIRSGYETPVWLAAEGATLVSLLCAAIFLHLRSKRSLAITSNWNRIPSVLLVVLAILSPAITRLVLSPAGISAAMEMVWMTMFGTGAIALALLGPGNREIGLSVISSGFLVLFTASSSDTQITVWLAVGWAVVCLWWLVANHWDRLEPCMSHTVRPIPMMRQYSTIAGVAFITIVGVTAWGRSGAPIKLLWGFMPTSGGQSYSDGTSRSGVGDGEAVVAATEHAASFGPVESDIFLESEQPSLYDMFDEALGEPFKNKQHQKAIALRQQQVLETKERPSESGRGGQSFSVSRESPRIKSNAKLEDSRAVLHWIGQLGVHLAIDRYDEFDGVEWRARDRAKDGQLQRQVLAGRVWYFTSRSNDAGLLRGVRQQALKVMALDTATIPLPVTVAGVHIKDVDRDDFFGIKADGAIYMPGRETIPRQTMIRVVSQQIDESALRCIDDFPHWHITNTGETVECTEGQQLLRRLAWNWAGDVPRGWAQIENVIDGLRTQFVLDRQHMASHEDPLRDFLEHGRGGDHLFATAAAEMLRSLGYRTRLVTGFYVNPKRYDPAAAETEVLPEDAHVWLEVQATSDVWLALEPTPGYRKSELRRPLIETAMRTLAGIAPAVIAVFATSLILWFSRRYWGECICRAVWIGARPFGPRGRLILWSRLLELRCWLARCPRPAGVPQRKWLSNLCAGSQSSIVAMNTCFDQLDAAVFGEKGLEKLVCLGPADEVMQRVTVWFLAKAHRDHMGRKVELKGN